MQSAKNVLKIFLFLVAVLSSQFDCYPNGEPIPWNGPFFSFGGPHAPACDPSPVNVPSSPARSPVRARSSSTPAKRPFSAGHEFIWLASNSNPHELFQVRKYNFTDDKKFKFQVGSRYLPIPTKEQTVFLTSQGEVLALVENYDFLAAIYYYLPKSRKYFRVKINIVNGAVSLLTKREKKVAQIRRQFLISKNFTRVL